MQNEAMEHIPCVPYNSSFVGIQMTGINMGGEMDLTYSSAENKTLTDHAILTQVGKHALAYRLLVTIERKANMFFARNDLLNVWGDGDTQEEALESLERFLLHDFMTYLKTPEKELDCFAKIELQRYKQLFQVAK